MTGPQPPAGPDPGVPQSGTHPAYPPQTLGSLLGGGAFARLDRVAGVTVGPYRLASLLGRGGMGAVFLATDLRTGRPVALKALLADAAAAPRLRRRFLREAELASRLAHPGLVRVLDWGEEGRIPWLAMEYVEGTTLDRHDDGPLDERLRRVLETARAVGYAHAQGVVHRDLKPANILIQAADGAARVTDFGVARDLNQASSLTASGTSVGTPRYMAPEQATGKPTSPATDVYALGTILYEQLTEQTPFDPGVGTIQFVQGLCLEAPRPPRDLAPGVPAAVERVCLRALAKDPAARYPDAGAFADALEEALEAPAGGGPRAGFRVALAAVVLLAVVASALLVLRPRHPTSSAVAGAPAGTAPQPSGADPVAAPTPTPPAPTQGEQRLVIQPGPILGKDTYVRSDGRCVNNNMGLTTFVAVGDRGSEGGDLRALLQFDLSRVPVDAHVERAVLDLAIAGLHEAAKPVTVEARWVVATRNANRQGISQTPWIEGTGGMDQTLDGVCWDGDLSQGRRFETRSGMPRFTQPEVERRADLGHGPNGVLDRVSVAPDAKGWVRLDLTAAVRRWVANPGTNYGLQLAHPTEGPPWQDGYVSFESSDFPDPSLRPKLTVEYSGWPPGPAPDEAALREARRAEARSLLEVLDQEQGGQPSQRTVQAAQRAVERAPFWGEAIFARARLEARLHQDARAFNDLLLVDNVAEPRQGPEVYALRATLGLKLGSVLLAHQDLTRALAARPGDAHLAALDAEARRRLGDAGGSAQPVSDPKDPFVGLYQTQRGRLRLWDQGGGVRGVYRVDGRLGTLQGKPAGRRLEVTWREGEATGEGYFELGPQGRTLSGGRRQGTARRGVAWTPWGATRLVPAAGARLLTVLEVRKDRLNPEAPQASRGETFRALLAPYPGLTIHVQPVSTPEQLLDGVRAVGLLAAPTALVIVCSDLEGAPAVAHRVVPVAALADALAGCPNLTWIHMSSGQFMRGDRAERLEAALPRRIPLTGFLGIGTWGSTITAEGLLVQLIVGKHIAPVAAVNLVREEVACARDVAPDHGTFLAAVGLRAVR